MRLCGKALPPKAATLLGANTLLLVLCVPLLLTFHSALAAPETFTPGQFVKMMIRLAVIGLFCQGIFYYSALYNLQIARDLGELSWRILNATGIMMLVLAAAFWIFPALSPGRDALIGFPVAAITVLLLTRRCALAPTSTTVALIGSEESCTRLQESIAQYPEWNLKVKAVYHPGELDSLAVPSSLGRIIVCADANLQPSGLERLIEIKLSGVRVESAARFYEQATGRVQLDQVGPTWFVFSSGFENDRRKLIVKRCFDLCAASVLAIVTLPLALIAAAAIAMECKGQIFYMQDRIGLHGKVFRIRKFRTMVAAPEKSHAQWTTAHDKRITHLGRIMRTFRVDELPQLLNVLMGEMSLVGPRPEQPYYCDLLAREIPFYHQRHMVPPGLTGWAQVRFTYGASVEESRRKLEFDLFYVKNLSIWLDLAIAFETLKVVLVGQGAR